MLCCYNNLLQISFDLVKAFTVAFGLLSILSVCYYWFRVREVYTRHLWDLRIAVTWCTQAPGRRGCWGCSTPRFFDFFFFTCQPSSAPLVGGEDLFFFWLVSSAQHPQSKKSFPGPWVYVAVTGDYVTKTLNFLTILRSLNSSKRNIDPVIATSTP